MGTFLFLITDATLRGQDNEQAWQKTVEKLNRLGFSRTYCLNSQKQFVQDQGKWEFEVEEEKDYPFSVRFSGPFAVEPTLYQACGVIDTIYKYSLLYQNHALDWFQEFREEVYQVMRCIGGTEVIYLADCRCDKLSDYLELMAWEGVPYHQIKERMIQEMGPPVTDYAALHYDQLDYSNIKEFFLDDFADLKNQKQPTGKK